jgi:hypothetical protein
VPLLLVAGLLFALVSAQQTLDRTEGRSLPRWYTLAGAFALAAAAQFCGARAWGSLFPGVGDRWALARAYHASQPGKYIPGGVGQGASQLALAVRGGMSLGAAGLGWATFQLEVVAVALGLGSGLALADDLAPWLRVVAALGLLALALLWRPVLVGGLGVLGKVLRRVPPSGHVPDQPLILVSAAWQLVFVVLHGTAMWLILDDLGGGVDLPRSVAGYGFALAVGILAVPVPSGLAVREAVLVAVLPAPASVVVTAAICHRLVTIGAELGAIAANLAVGRLAGRRQVPSAL